jgi:hypothetical protein
MRLSGFGVVLVGVIAACSSSSNSGGSLDGGLGGTGTGGGSPPSCTAFSACGGNIVGTWHITAFCGPGTTQTQPVDMCPGGTVTATFTGTGTMVFNADSTYTFASTTMGTGTAVLPNSCLTGTTCAEVQTSLVGGQITSATCTGDNTNCNCKLVIAPQQSMVAGTYTVSGTTVTTTPGDGSAGGSAQYCVNGTQLSTQSTDATGRNLIMVANK